MSTGTDQVEHKLRTLGLELPASSPSRANFLPYKRSGNLLFLAGQICEWNGVPQYFGPVREGYDLAEAKKAAEMCALNLLFNIRAATGSLDRVAGVVRLGAFISAPAGFPDGPKIADGASELFIHLYGEAGRHARTAVCVSSLPANGLVEIDAIVELGALSKPR
ncbi:enamine deaminase RidA (YjgF/YER057c/UK114 family) [Rhizobium petrolearium]|uniref:RidA family protein n=1 Tax=Neorhizobium petrolearium TaxID=515361 RepID=UPI001AEAE6B7|nr:RidA family protein [Neorhizobium petrolearium]MBP1845509.1 enamine deaminase RidA (YjgF/YER057c/UK114 family) [Neorhizobium petrolearium]